MNELKRKKQAYADEKKIDLIKRSYTKGPWKSKKGSSIINIGGICSLAPAGRHAPETEYQANAYLICAAPELLEALKSMNEAYLVLANKLGTKDDSIMFRAREAIAKAEGNDK